MGSGNTHFISPMPENVVTADASNIAQVYINEAVRPVAPIINATIQRPPRRPRYIYTAAQKRSAILWLDEGVTSREVARRLGPRCSSSTPIRWRQQARRLERSRRIATQLLQKFRRYTS